MRDLAKRNFSDSGSANTSKKFLRIILILIIGGGLFYFATQRLFKNKIGGDSSIALSDAPKGLKAVSVNVDSITESGVDLKTQTASLKDVKYNGKASGSATRTFGGGLYILSVDVTVPEQSGVNYEVWLVGEGGIKEVDFMRGSKSSWSLNLRDTDKYSKYSGIWVTLERTKEDGKSEEHVLEGSF